MSIISEILQKADFQATIKETIYSCSGINMPEYKLKRSRQSFIDWSAKLFPIYKLFSDITPKDYETVDKAFNYGISTNFNKELCNEKTS